MYIYIYYDCYFFFNTRYLARKAALSYKPIVGLLCSAAAASTFVTKPSRKIPPTATNNQ